MFDAGVAQGSFARHAFPGASPPRGVGQHIDNKPMHLPGNHRAGSGRLPAGDGLGLFFAGRYRQGGYLWTPREKLALFSRKIAEGAIAAAIVYGACCRKFTFARGSAWRPKECLACANETREKTSTIGTTVRAEVVYTPRTKARMSATIPKNARATHHSGRFDHGLVSHSTYSPQ